MIDGRVISDSAGARVRLEGSDCSLALLGTHAATGPVKVFFRPSAVHLSSERSEEFADMPARVEDVIYLGGCRTKIQGNTARRPKTRSSAKRRVPARGFGSAESPFRWHRCRPAAAHRGFTAVSTALNPGVWHNQVPPARARRRKWRATGSVLFAIPAIVVLTAVFIFPLLQFLTRGFNDGFAAYRRLVTSSLYARVFLSTLEIAIIVTVVTVALAYPVAAW